MDYSHHTSLQLYYKYDFYLYSLPQVPIANNTQGLLVTILMGQFFHL